MNLNLIKFCNQLGVSLTFFSEQIEFLLFVTRKCPHIKHRKLISFKADLQKFGLQFDYCGEKLLWLPEDPALSKCINLHPLLHQAVTKEPLDLPHKRDVSGSLVLLLLSQNCLCVHNWKIIHQM